MHVTQQLLRMSLPLRHLRLEAALEEMPATAPTAFEMNRVVVWNHPIVALRFAEGVAITW